MNISEVGNCEMNQPQIRILNTQTVCEWSKYRTLSVVKRRVDGTRQYGRCGRGDEKESAVTASEKSAHCCGFNLFWTQT